MSLITPDDKLRFDYKIYPWEDYDWGKFTRVDITIGDALSSFKFSLHGKNGQFEEFVNMVCKMQNEFEELKNEKSKQKEEHGQI